MDLPLLSDGYDIDDYLVNHENEDTPWIVSNFPNTESMKNNFIPIFNVEYPLGQYDYSMLNVDIDTSRNHLRSDNHMKNQLGNVFIPSVVDKALNSLLNSDAILMQSNPIVRIANERHQNDDDDIDDDVKSIDHIHDAVSIIKPFRGYKKQTITSGNRL